MLELPYIAGFVDGEGCIKFYNYGGKTKTIRYVTVANTYLPVLQEMQDQFGGRVYQRGNGKLGKKPTYAWTLTRIQDIVMFLDAIMPYLREKRSDAEELLASCKLANRTCKRYDRKAVALTRVS